MGQIVIQRCTDAAVIAGIHQAAISVAYRPFFPGSPPPTAAELREEWMTALADPTAVGLLAIADGHPAGSVLIRADQQFPGGELHALHVLPAEWGHGIGSALHDRALDVLAGTGYDTAWLWVLAGNDRARRMYERRGWTAHADIAKDYLGVQEFRYSRPLTRHESQDGGLGIHVGDVPLKIDADPRTRRSGARRCQDPGKMAP